MTTGIYYPLEVTSSGDVRLASTNTEDLVASWARYIIDTEQPFQLFQPTTDEVALGVEKFKYSLMQKVPLVDFSVTTEMTGNQLYVNLRWQERSVQIAIN